jgi:hypothetical protein
MWKKVLLALPLLFSLLSCEGVSLGGNSNEVDYCRGVTQHHAKSLKLYLTVNCSYEKKCDVSLFFWGGNYRDSLSGKCYSDYDLMLKTKDSLKQILSETENLVPLDSDFHLRFSLLDINNVEKKYDIDLSGIVNSYIVRGDTVDLNVMENCSLHLYHCKKETIYGNLLNGEKYSFFTSDGCDKDYSYDCTWHNLGPSKNDDLEISATIYWNK